MRTVLVLIASVTLCTGCLPQERHLPDESIPHRIAREATVWIWVRRADGSLVQERVRAAEGWWLASSRVVEE